MGFGDGESTLAHWILLPIVMGVFLYAAGWRINVALGVGVLVGLMFGLFAGGVAVLIARGVLGLVPDPPVKVPVTARTDEDAL